MREHRKHYELPEFKETASQAMGEATQASKCRKRMSGCPSQTPERWTGPGLALSSEEGYKT